MQIYKIISAFERLLVVPGECILLLEELCVESPTELMPYCNTIVSNLPRLLEPGVPRRCQDLAQQLWMKINNLQPMRYAFIQQGLGIGWFSNK